MKCMKNEGLENHTRGKTQGFRPKSKWVWGLEREESVKEVKRHKFVKREWEKWIWFSRWNYLEKTCLDGSRICRALILDRYICRGAVENLLTAKIPRWIKKLLRSYWPDRNFLDGSRICREAIEKNSRKLQWIENAIRSVEKRSSRVSIDSYLSRFVEKLLSLIKIDFSKRGKTQKWLQLSKLLNRRSKQHVKLSKTSLNKKMQSIHRSKTHAHTKQV